MSRNYGEAAWIMKVMEDLDRESSEIEEKIAMLRE